MTPFDEWLLSEGAGEIERGAVFYTPVSVTVREGADIERAESLVALVQHLTPNYPHFRRGDA